ncbi:MAG: DUF2207 domain-containing protein [Clostridia bacterium]|nr:DUF2207 domain-containing protein [Clostridia bacterium]
MESDTHVDRYDITYDITSDRRISATERIEIYFDGDPAFERLLEISNGEMVRNLKAVELVEGTDGEELEQEVEYQVASTRYHDFAVEIGGETNKYGTHTYLLTYDYCLTRADNNYTLTFRAFEKKQEFVSDKTSVSITCYLPDGYQNDAASYLVSDDESEEFAEWTQNEVDGRTVISTSFSDYEEGMDFVIRMTFRDGSGSGTLTKFRDRSPLWFAVAAAGLIVITLILKFTVFRGGRRKNAMGLEAMKRMDPMLMGKFADNRVGKEDISSLVMYWANMGYLKMDLTDPDDPVLVRTVHLLPETEREYEKYLFYNLFKEGKRIKLSSLKNKYYVLADAAAEHVNETTRGLYNTASIVVSLIITLIGIVLLGIAPLVVAQIQVSSAVTYYMSFIVIIPALIIYAVMETLVYNSFKSGRVMNGCLIAAVIVMCALTVIAYVFLIPSYIVGNLSKEVISEAFCILFIVAPLLICKSRKYSSELDDITSFKAAIKKSTPDDIEGWYAADPQLYYKIMPYARVMGLAQYWEDKNQGMPIPPADWAILPASLGDNPAFEQAEPLQRKASEQLYSVLSSRPAPREEERKKEEHEKHDEGRKGAE